jgi:hypothetical protein
VINRLHNRFFLQRFAIPVVDGSGDFVYDSETGFSLIFFIIFFCMVSTMPPDMVTGEVCGKAML